MAKLITKFTYLKRDDRKKPGSYAKYIATREGVEKIDDSRRCLPATEAQKRFIRSLINDFPDVLSMPEYEKYSTSPMRGNATDLITKILDDRAEELAEAKTYADYIATRPRVEKIGSHGLFSDEGKPIQLSKVSEELNQYEGNVWTVILSLKREDAERLGFNSGERWRQMLRAHTQEISDQFHIPLTDLKWYAAFHNEETHPHVHLIVYSSNPQEGYLSKKGIENLRSSFAKEIFHNELLSLYEKQTVYRDAIRKNGKEIAERIVSEMLRGTYRNPDLEQKLYALSATLAKTRGKKKYGYLKNDTKYLIDSIVDVIASEPEIAELYDLWYGKKEEILRTYTDHFPERIPLEKNPEFTSVKNAVIQEALRLISESSLEDDYNYSEEDILSDSSSAFTKESGADFGSGFPKKENDLWRLYRSAKHLINPDSEEYNPEKGILLLQRASGLGCSAADYLLGKIYLYGEIADRNIPEAIKCLEKAAAKSDPNAQFLLAGIFFNGEFVESDRTRAQALLKSAAENGHPYAAQMLSSIQDERDPFLSVGIVRLLYHISRILQNRIQGRSPFFFDGATDHKLRRAIDEKKQLHGLKPD